MAAGELCLRSLGLGRSHDRDFNPEPVTETPRTRALRRAVSGDRASPAVYLASRDAAGAIVLAIIPKTFFSA